MSLAEKLVSLRKEKGLTQMDLAERLNVSRQAISRWEVGSSVPSTDNLKVLSELYEVSLDYLLSDGVKELSTNGEGRIFEDIREKKNESKFQKKKMMITTAALLVVLVLIIFAVRAPGKKSEKFTPIENMTVIEIEENNYPIVTFSIE